jgi:hypothetical protein
MLWVYGKRTFACRNKIVLIIFDHGRKAEVGDRARMAMAS